MVPWLSALEASGFSTWLREYQGLLGFPGVLTLHTWGLAFLVGTSVAIAGRVLGLAPGMPPSSLDRLFPVMWAGFWVNAVSGVLLLVAYPTKALTNPLFYAKLLLIAVALVLMQTIRHGLRRPDAASSRMPVRLRQLAVVSLAAWGASIFAGRLLAYTYRYLTAYEMTR